MVASPGKGELRGTDHTHSDSLIWDPYWAPASQLGLNVYNVWGCLENFIDLVYNRIAHMKINIKCMSQFTISGFLTEAKVVSFSV